MYHQITDLIDDQLAVSHDGLIWYRHHEPIIPLGAVGTGYEGMCRTYAGGILELPDGSWAVSHECNPGLHNQGGFRMYPERPANLHSVTNKPVGPCSMRWARWKPHRLCGIDAGLEGRFTIRTADRNASELRLNYRCLNGGYVVAELIRVVPGRLSPDMDGLPGFTFADCDRLTGDSLDEAVSWRGRSDISEIGDSVAIRLKIFRAKVFAYMV